MTTQCLVRIVAYGVMHDNLRLHKLYLVYMMTDIVGIIQLEL